MLLHDAKDPLLPVQTLNQLSTSWVADFHVERRGVFIDSTRCIWGNLVPAIANARIPFWIYWGCGEPSKIIARIVKSFPQSVRPSRGKMLALMPHVQAHLASLAMPSPLPTKSTPRVSRQAWRHEIPFVQSATSEDSGAAGDWSTSSAPNGLVYWSVDEWGKGFDSAGPKNEQERAESSSKNSRRKGPNLNVAPCPSKGESVAEYFKKLRRLLPLEVPPAKPDHTANWKGSRKTKQRLYMAGCTGIKYVHYLSNANVTLCASKHTEAQLYE